MQRGDHFEPAESRVSRQHNPKDAPSVRTRTDRLSFWTTLSIRFETFLTDFLAHLERVQTFFLGPGEPCQNSLHPRSIISPFAISTRWHAGCFSCGGWPFCFFK